MLAITTDAGNAMVGSCTKMQQQIVILGGSYAGISTTHYLLKHVVPKSPGSNECHVILVNASEQTMCRPACPRAMISDDLFEQTRLFVPIVPQFDQYSKVHFGFVHGIATGVDLQGRTISINRSDGGNEHIKYHALIIATGASAPSPMLGPNVDIPHLKQSWSTFRDSLSSVKSIVIAGGGPAGVEVAGELGEHLNGRPSWFTFSRPTPKVPITLITSATHLLPHLRPALALKAESLLSILGVTVLKSTHVTTVSPPTAGYELSSLTTAATLTLHNTTTDTTSTLDTDIFVPCTGLKPNTTFLPASLLASDGRVATHTATLRVEHPDAGPRVYALGDASNAARPAVHNVLAQVPVVCASIREDLLFGRDDDGGAVVAAVDGGGSGGGGTGMRGKPVVFKEDLRETQLVPIGTRTGVGAAMGWRMPGWAVWAIKGRDYWLWTTERLWSGRQWDGMG